MKRYIKSDNEILEPAFDSYDEAMNSEFLDIENEVFSELGIFADFSSVRGSGGTIFFYSDLNGENDSDMWFGDDDALLASIDFGQYEDDLRELVWTCPENEMKAAFRSYIEQLIS